MKRDNILQFISEEFESWNDIYDYFKREKIALNMPQIKGWFIAFDGPSIGEMYLTSEHPSGDLSGETITIHDFNEVKT
jgi:hypothetical protein